MQKRVTIADLAKVLGIDKSSVSLALRDSPKMSLATRARVQRAAREHHYMANWAAKRLAGTTDHAVGLALPNASARQSFSPIARTIHALTRLCAERGVTLSLVANDWLSAGKEHPPRQPHVDGMLVWGDVAAASASWFSAAYALPSIVLDPHHPTYARHAGNAIRLRNKEAAGSVVSHLFDRGARRLMFVQIVTEHLGHEDRWRGARQAWLERSSAATLFRCQVDQLSDGDISRFASGSDAAIFCSNDIGAMQIWRRLEGLGISVPKTVKLAGLDGDDSAAQIGLTSAAFDADTMARKALSGLLKLMTNEAEKLGYESIPLALRIGTTS